MNILNSDAKMLDEMTADFEFDPRQFFREWFDAFSERKRKRRAEIRNFFGSTSCAV